MRATVAGTGAGLRAPEWDIEIGGATADIVRAIGDGEVTAVGSEMAIKMTFFRVGAITVGTDSIGGTRADSGNVTTFVVSK